MYVSKRTLTGAVHENHEIDKIWIFYSCFFSAYSYISSYLCLYLVIVSPSTHLFRTSLAWPVLVAFSAEPCVVTMAFHFFCHFLFCRSFYYFTLLLFWPPFTTRRAFSNPSKCTCESLISFTAMELLLHATFKVKPLKWIPALACGVCTVRNLVLASMFLGPLKIGNSGTSSWYRKIEIYSIPSSLTVSLHLGFQGCRKVHLVIGATSSLVGLLLALHRSLALAQGESSISLQMCKLQLLQLKRRRGRWESGYQRWIMANIRPMVSQWGLQKH